MRKPGALVAGGPSYDMMVVVPRNLVTVNDTCNGQRIVYGGRCQIQVRYNGAAPPEPTGVNGYAPLSYNINITATPTDGGAVLNKTKNVRVLDDPLSAVLVRSNGYVGTNAYKSNNILDSRWNRINLNVPAIQTYSLGYSAGDWQTAYPILALKTRCTNKLIYLVVQRKMDNNIIAGNDGNVTIKYHALISDGVYTGTPGNNRAINGNVSLREAGQAAINFGADVNAHDGLWSGAQNIPRLRNLITTVTSPNNNYLVSHLSNIAPHNPFVDPQNQGAVQVITVHSLLTGAQYNQLLNYLNAGHGAGRLINLLDAGNNTLDGTAKDSLIAYRNEVARACAV